MHSGQQAGLWQISASNGQLMGSYTVSVPGLMHVCVCVCSASLMTHMHSQTRKILQNEHVFAVHLPSACTRCRRKTATYAHASKQARVHLGECLCEVTNESVRVHVESSGV